MNILKSFHYKRYEVNWLRLTVQGLLIFLTGLTFAFASTIKAEAVVMHAQLFSWLPVCGIILASLGVLGCLDGLFAKDPSDFVQRLQTGVLDTVVGILIIMGISATPERLCSLIAGFLLVRGIGRLAMAYTMGFRLIILTLLSGIIPILLGIMVYLGWPHSEGWFLALCLSLEIALRGFAMMIFGLWLRERRDIEVV